MPGPATVAPPYVTHPPPIVPVLATARIECLPDQVNITARQCYDAGCSYEERLLAGHLVPWCYVNRDIAGYRLVTTTPSVSGQPDREIFNLTRIHKKQLYSTPFVRPELLVNKKTRSTLQFKVVILTLCEYCIFICPAWHHTYPVHL